MRWKPALLSLLFVAMLPTLLRAQIPDRKEDDYRRFVDRHVCPVTAYLHALSKSELTRNQFIILNPKDDPSRYVQCLFRIGEPVYCEASSYYYRNPPGGPEKYRISNEKRLVLEGYRFTFKPRGNFLINVERPDDDDYEPFARFLLTVLYEAYDVRFANLLRIDIPLTLDTTQASQCKALPVS